MRLCLHLMFLLLQIKKTDRWLERQNVFGKVSFISLHIRSMWETICDAQAGFWLNSKFLSKSSRKPLSGISDQKAPPPLVWKTSDFRWPKFTPKYPPPVRKTSDFRWPKFTQKYPPPPVQKTSDLRWPKFTPKCPLPFRKTSDLRWPKFTPKYPLPLFEKSGRSYVETNL